MAADKFNLPRFLMAQEPVYLDVLSELKSGQKRGHWMWFIFPQLAGLGRSEMAQRYAISGREEAQAYLSQPILGARLRECAQIVKSLSGRSALAIFGTPDDLKLCSCLTLFEAIEGPHSVFTQLIDQYFSGVRDAATLRLLETLDQKVP